MNAEVVIYGASGYTGKLIAWHLAEYGIPFIAAGRNQQRLEQQMASIAELEGHDYQCVAVDHSEEAIRQLLEGKKVVYNVVGTFMQLAEPVVRAALASGCHYLDTTGEQDWMFHARQEYGAKFEAAGLLLIPACSWMWVGGLLAAELALEHPGIDSLDMLYLADSYTSVASTMSFMRMLVNDQFPTSFLVWRMVVDQLGLEPSAELYEGMYLAATIVLESLTYIDRREATKARGKSDRQVFEDALAMSRAALSEAARRMA